jgi:hypothetical protein
MGRRLRVRVAYFGKMAYSPHGTAQPDLFMHQCIEDMANVVKLFRYLKT